MEQILVVEDDTGLSQGLFKAPWFWFRESHF